ncbi:MAG: hypothetical protein LBV51_02995 [Acholeplasmatales bacterium]|jgi:hypothetical protein|nr:hypothetical protein [Acholeplasmatales bacterium]
MVWWNGLNDFQQIVFIFASSSSLLLLIFLILMLIGLGSHADFDDVDSSDFSDGGGDLNLSDDVDFANDEPLSMASGLRLISLRGVLAFFAVGGWVAFSIADNIPWWLALIIGIVCGAIAMLLIAIVFKQFGKLEQSGNLDYGYAIGKQAVVYIRIPANNGGLGKVIVQFSDKYLEVDAMTNGNADILNNEFVVVSGLKDKNILIVEKL